MLPSRHPVNNNNCTSQTEISVFYIPRYGHFELSCVKFFRFITLPFFSSKFVVFWKQGENGKLLALFPIHSPHADDETRNMVADERQSIPMRSFCISFAWKKRNVLCLNVYADWIIGDFGMGIWLLKLFAKFERKVHAICRLWFFFFLRLTKETVNYFLLNKFLCGE